MVMFGGLGVGTMDESFFELVSELHQIIDLSQFLSRSIASHLAPNPLIPGGIDSWS